MVDGLIDVSYRPFFSCVSGESQVRLPGLRKDFASSGICELSGHTMEQFALKS